MLFTVNGFGRDYCCVSCCLELGKRGGEREGVSDGFEISEARKSGNSRRSLVVVMK